MLDKVTTNILHTNNISVDSLDSHLNKLLTNGADFADFYLQTAKSESWGLDEGIIKSGSYVHNQGMSIRAICGEKTIFSHTNTINAAALPKLVDNLFVEKAHSNYFATTAKAQQQRAALYHQQDPIISADSGAKVALLQQIDQQARSLPQVINVIANTSLDYEEIYIARSDMRHAADIRPLVRINITVIVTNSAGKIEKFTAGGGGRYDFSYFTSEMITGFIRQAHSQALLKLEAKACPAGAMPVVLGNGWAGIILHEAIGHGLEGDFNRKGSSAFSGKVGQQVASKTVTVVDDGTLANKRGSLNIDDEGNLTQRNILIENGVLVGYLWDELNANIANTSSTGSGRRESFASIPMPRMTNTFMLNGSYDPAEIIASVKYGLYAEHFEGGQVDITSGQFVFNAAVAWVIENGKLSYPVKGCALVGSGPECLQYVSMVGNDLALDSGVGTCGKDGQCVPVGVGQPTLLLTGGLVVGG